MLHPIVFSQCTPIQNKLSSKVLTSEQDSYDPAVAVTRLLDSIAFRIIVKVDAVVKGCEDTARLEPVSLRSCYREPGDRRQVQSAVS